MSAWPGSPEATAERDDDRLDDAMDAALARVAELERRYYAIPAIGETASGRARWIVAARNAALLDMVGRAWLAAAHATTEAPAGRHGHATACSAAARLASVERSEWRRIAGMIAADLRTAGS